MVETVQLSKANTEELQLKLLLITKSVGFAQRKECTKITEVVSQGRNYVLV